MYVWNEPSSGRILLMSQVASAHRILDINVIYIENAVLPWTNVLTLDIKVVNPPARMLLLTLMSSIL